MRFSDNGERINIYLFSNRVFYCGIYDIYFITKALKILHHIFRVQSKFH